MSVIFLSKLCSIIFRFIKRIKPTLNEITIGFAKVFLKISEFLTISIVELALNLIILNNLKKKIVNACNIKIEINIEAKI